MQTTTAPSFSSNATTTTTPGTAEDTGHHDCIFCKILNGTIPSYKVYEDEKVVAFLDAFPVAKGHVLVVPKAHAATMADLSAEDASALGAALPKVAKGVIDATGVSNYNLLQNNGKVAGQVVFHVHVHVLPRAEGDGLGLFNWTPGTLSADHAKELMSAISSKISD